MSHSFLQRWSQLFWGLKFSRYNFVRYDEMLTQDPIIISMKAIQFKSISYVTTIVYFKVSIVWFTFGLSNSIIFPFSITPIRSESMIVFKRWAIVITVQSLNSVLIVFWINASVLKLLVQIFLSMVQHILIMRYTTLVWLIHTSDQH